MALYEYEHSTSDKKLEVATDNFPTQAFPHGIIVGAFCFPQSQTGHIMSLFRHLVVTFTRLPLHTVADKLSSSIRFSRESMLMQMISLLYISYLSINLFV